MNNHFITRTNHSASNRSFGTTTSTPTSDRRPARRTSRIALMGAMVGASVLGLTLPASALPKRGVDRVPRPTAPPKPTVPRRPIPAFSGEPRFIARLVSFRAVDESGRDFLGSDEPFFVLTTQAGAGISTTRTGVFGDVDTGDTRQIAPALCASPNCASGSGGFSFQVNLLESDIGGDPTELAAKIDRVSRAAGWIAAITTFLVTGDPTSAAAAKATADKIDKSAAAQLVALLGDDLLGSETVVYPLTDLVAAMPTVGSSFEEEIYLGKDKDGIVDFFDGGADYRVKVRLTRVNDAPLQLTAVA